MFIKLWLDVKLSTINPYFALWLIETDVFQIPQLHKHFNVSGKQAFTVHNFNSFLQMQEQHKDIERTLVHEFWSCKRELQNFTFYASILKTSAQEKEVKILCFTAYGNYLRHLYSFFEGIIKNKNIELLSGLKQKEIGPKISLLLTEEVEKLIRNKVFVYESKPELDKREIAALKSLVVTNDFGTYLRNIRNWFSHVDDRRVNEKEISLSDFYRKYHKFTLLLFESANFTWSDRTNYDWGNIEDFTKNI